MKNQIQWMEINELTPYENNPRNNLKAVKRVADSIQEFGFNQPIVVDKDNIIVVGHTRWKASKELGLKEVPVLYMPDDISDAKVKAYRIADNKLNEYASWDDELLLSELEDIKEIMGDVESTGFSEKNLDDLMNKTDDAYTKKIDTPIYEPKGENPSLDTLYNDTHAMKLMADIKNSTVPDDIKKFLSLAAYRHVEFNYKRIAEYYAHADADTQKLIEDSAMVIVDFDRAIELGYVKLRDDLLDSYSSDYPENIV